MRDARRDLLVVALLVVLTVGVNLPLLAKYPAPASDEANFVDPAVTLLRHGVLATDVNRDLLPGIERHLYWQPPLYFVLLAGWFHFVGIGLLQARLFSLMCAVLVVIGVYLLSRRHAAPWPSGAAAALCAISIWLMNSARLARMDTLCVALTLASALLYARADERLSRLALALCGTLAGLAFLSHPLGAVAIAVVTFDLLTRSNETLGRRISSLLIVMSCFGCGLAAWLVYILRDPLAFQLQIGAQLARKNALGSYWNHFWMAKTHVFSLLLVLYAGFWLMLRRGSTAKRTVAWGFLISFAAASYGREAQYHLYFYVWGCCAVAILLNEVRIRRTWLYASLLLAFANDATIVGHDIWRYRHRDYASLTRTVRQAIPVGASVFIGFPEVTPYFALLDRNPMRVAVPVPTLPPDAHLRAAAASEFIVESAQLAYLPELRGLLKGRQPIAVVDQGPGYYLAIFKTTLNGPASKR